MKVPVIDSPGGGVGAELYTNTSPNADSGLAGKELNQGWGALEQGVSALTRGAQQGADAYEAAAKKREAEANAAKAGDAYAQLQKDAIDELQGNSKGPDGSTRAGSQAIGDAAFGGYDATQGFLATRGEDALARSADVYKRLELRQQEISAKYLANDAQRKLFAQRSATVMLDAQRQIEAHVSQQRVVAKQATADNVAFQALQSSATDPDDPLYMQKRREVGQTIDALGLPAGEAEKRKALFAQAQASQAVEGLVAAGRYADAEQALEDEKDVLGTRYPELKARFEHQKAAGEKNGALATVDEAVDSTAAKSINPVTGFVDTTKLQELILATPAGPQRKAMEEAVARRLKVENDLQKATADGWKNAAVGIVLRQGKTLDAGLEAKIAATPGGQAFLDGLHQAVINRARAAQIHATGSRSAIADARREQDRANQAGIWDFESTFGRDDGKDVDVATWATENAPGMDDYGIKHLQAIQAGWKAQADKGLTGEAARFVRDAENDPTLKALLVAKGGKLKAGVPVDAREQLRVHASRAFDTFVKEKGRAPNQEEQAKLLLDLANLPPAEQPRSLLGIPLPPKKVPGIAVPPAPGGAAGGPALGLDLRPIIRNNKTKKRFYLNANGSVGEEVPEGTP